MRHGWPAVSTTQPGLALGRTRSGFGLFATRPLAAGAHIVTFGGRPLSASEVTRLDPAQRAMCLQVEERVYLWSQHPHPADRINHSCEPNAGMRSAVDLVAMRDIAPGEQVCFDYAMTDGSPYDEFRCSCRAVSCRGEITGMDWMDEQLRARYAGFFSPYLDERILRLSA